MKLKDCKEGMYVLAKDKTIGQISFDEFLKQSPLSIGKVTGIALDGAIQILLLDEEEWMSCFYFNPEDLIELEDETK